jgi:hypothetical protein
MSQGGKDEAMTESIALTKTLELLSKKINDSSSVTTKIISNDKP